MKRKLIKQGNNSYTITLPAKWIKEKGLNSQLKNIYSPNDREREHNGYNRRCLKKKVRCY